MSNTSNTSTNTARAAILVDFDLYSAFPEVQRWVERREGKCEFVLLVSDPAHNDYDPEAPRWANGTEFAAVIRNSGHIRDMVFKTSALCVVQDSSNLIPVVALDADTHVLQMFEDGGVLVTLSRADELIYY